MKHLIFLLALGIGLGCLITFHLSDSYVDAEGFLREPFALLPIGFALSFFGGLGLLATQLIGLQKNRSS